MALIPWRKLRAALSGKDDVDSIMNIVKHSQEVSVSEVEISGDYLPRSGGTMSGAIAMGSNKITGLAAGSTSGDAARYEQVLLLAGGTMSGNIAMGSNKVTGLAAAASNGDATRYEQVLLLAGGTMAGNIAMGSNDITGVDAITAVSATVSGTMIIPTGA